MNQINKTLYLFTAIVFGLMAAGYAAVLVVDFYTGVIPGWLITLHILVVIVSSAACWLSVRRYKRLPKEPNEKPKKP